MLVYLSMFVNPFSTLFIMEILKPLTCCGDAVKAHKGVEAGGSTRQDTSEAKRSKTTLSKFLLNSAWHQKRDMSFNNQTQMKQ